MGADDGVSATAPTERGPRVLLVDDESWVRRALERVLVSSGYHVDAVGSGEEALSILSHEQYDSVVSDLTMPGLSGLELLRAIRQNDLDLPVVLVTGNPSLESAVEAVEYGAMCYLVKPVEPEHIRNAVATAVRLHQLARLRRELVIFTGESAKQIADRAGLEARFENALANLYFVYQPVVRWSSREVIGYETFVRSSEPSLADSRALLDAAERLKRIHELGRAIRGYCTLPFSEAANRPQLFVNIHELELLDESLYAKNSALTLLADQVILELSERARLETVNGIANRICDLRSRGFRIAIDDIGAGYAGLSGFAMLKPDLVKLDVALVRDVDQALAKRRLVRSTISICRELGIEVVAEGVETLGELETLTDLGCDVLQGYLFARPSSKLAERLDWPVRSHPMASA